MEGKVGNEMKLGKGKRKGKKGREGKEGKSRKVIAQQESKRLFQVVQHPAFTQSPLQAIKSHLESKAKLGLL